MENFDAIPLSNPILPAATSDISFEALPLPELVQASLKRMNLLVATPIQAQAIPLALANNDIIGSAQTGTGKTAAFVIPMVVKLLAAVEAKVDCTALVLTPTRELANQVMDVVKKILGGKQCRIDIALLVGGEPIWKQMRSLRNRPLIVVGTPGRVNDHLSRESLQLDDTCLLVLDETDRMLDMGFSPQIEAILQYLPTDRQTLMFSATLPANILQLSRKYLRDPKRISVGISNAVATKVVQEAIRTTETKKFDHLLAELEKREGSAIVFVNTRDGADEVAFKLRRENHTVEALHGNLQQFKREKIIKGFRSKHFRILVATDIVARGIDIPHIELVINYELPRTPADYVHRIGRTARAENEGTAISLISPKDNRRWSDIERLMEGKDSCRSEVHLHVNRGRGGDRPYGQNRDGQSRGRSFGNSGEGRSFSRDRASSSEGRSYAPRENSGSSEGRRFSHTGGSGSSGSTGRSYAPRDGSGSSEGRSFSRDRAPSAEGRNFSKEGGRNFSKGGSTPAKSGAGFAKPKRTFKNPKSAAKPASGF